MNMQVVTETPTKTNKIDGIRDEDNKEETEVEALNNNKVDVDIEPDVKSNDVVVQICSCSLIFNCFSAK